LLGVLFAVIGAEFWRSIFSGQSDDVKGPSHSILLDNDEASQYGAGGLTQINDRFASAPENWVHTFLQSRGSRDGRCNPL
jgi:cbb3-type cytochrome oxidase maturation protein